MGQEQTPDCLGWATGRRCGACFVCRLTAVFREVRRVLRPDGTLWVNVMGGYASSKQGDTNGRSKSGLRTNIKDEDARRRHNEKMAEGRQDIGVENSPPSRWPAKNYVNTPALLAESMRVDGWILRSEITLTKVAPMPSSVRDRPTTACEKLFLFAKKGRYFYDQEAERIPHQDAEREANRPARRDNYKKADAASGVYRLAEHQPSMDEPMAGHVNGRNLWDYWGDAPGESDDDLPSAVWQWRPEPSKARHYATYPLWLPLRVIRLATSARGCCPACGAPWAREVERSGGPGEAWVNHEDDSEKGFRKKDRASAAAWESGEYQRKTLGWRPSCKCPPSDPVPARVLDPFCGTATSGVAARLLGRCFTGIELSPEYAQISRERLASACPLDDATWNRAPAAKPEEPSLFGKEEP